MTLTRCLEEAIARLDDERLRAELRAAERCAGLATRTRREAALLRVRCIRQELARRAQPQGDPIALVGA